MEFYYLLWISYRLYLVGFKLNGSQKCLACCNVSSVIQFLFECVSFLSWLPPPLRRRSSLWFFALVWRRLGRTQNDWQVTGSTSDMVGPGERCSGERPRLNLIFNWPRDSIWALEYNPTQPVCCTFLYLYLRLESKQPLPALSNQVRKLFWNADIGTYRWCGSYYVKTGNRIIAFIPRMQFKFIVKFGIIFYFLVLKGR